MKMLTLVFPDSTAYKLTDDWLTSAQKVTETQAWYGDVRSALVAVPGRLQKHEEDIPPLRLPLLGACATGNPNGQSCIVHGVRVCRPAEDGIHKDKH